MSRRAKERRRIERARTRAGQTTMDGTNRMSGQPDTMSNAADCEHRAVDPADDPASYMSMKRLRFAILWAEADPDDTLEEIARAAGYSASSAASGLVAELRRDPDVLRVRKERLLELQKASGVTPEDALIGLRQIATSAEVLPKDRVAAFKVILAWYSANKAGPGGPKGNAAQGQAGGAEGMADALAKALALQLGIPAEETAAP